MNLPKDPVMLLSVINTALRDEYSSLEELVKSTDSSEEDIRSKLATIDYHYDEELNQFK